MCKQRAGLAGKDGNQAEWERAARKVSMESKAK